MLRLPQRASVPLNNNGSSSVLTGRYRGFIVRSSPGTIMLTDVTHNRPQSLCAVFIEKAQDFFLLLLCFA